MIYELLSKVLCHTILNNYLHNYICFGRIIIDNYPINDWLITPWQLGLVHTWVYTICLTKLSLSHTHKHTHTHTNTHKYTCMYTYYIHASTYHTHTHKYTHTPTHAHANTHRRRGSFVELVPEKQLWVWMMMICKFSVYVGTKAIQGPTRDFILGDWA